MRSTRPLLLAALIGVYGLCYPLIRVGSASADPLDFALLRAAFAAVAAMVLAGLRSEPLVPSAGARPWVAGLGLCTTIQFAAMFPSPAATGTSVAVVLGNLGPLFAVILGHLVLNEPIGRRAIAALGFGLVGVSVIASSGGAVGTPWGWVLPLSAAAAGASGAVLFKRCADGTPTITVVAGQFVVATAGLAVLRLGTGDPWTVRWTASFVVTLATLALLGSVAASVVWYGLLRRGQVGRLSLHLLGVPAVGVLTSWAFLGDGLTGRATIGLALCLVALTVLQWPVRHTDT